MTQQKFKAAPQGPVLDIEPDYLTDIPPDNLVGAIVALTAELYLLRERLHTLEAELAAHRVLPADAVERHVDDATSAEAKAVDLAAYTQRVFGELVRNRQPVSQIDPRVSEYLGD